MRNEYEIKTELDGLKADYHKLGSDAVKPAELKKLSDKIIALNQELSDCITEGAKPCPGCGDLPLGIHQPNYYEIGCMSCTYDRKEPDGSASKRSIRSKGAFREEAVENWNSGTCFDKLGGVVSEFRREGITD